MKLAQILHHYLAQKLLIVIREIATKIVQISIQSHFLGSIINNRQENCMEDRRNCKASRAFFEQDMCFYKGFLGFLAVVF